MNAPRVTLEELPYTPDSGDLFARLLDLPGAALLDSSYPHCLSGRYDIMVADPLVKFELSSIESYSYDSYKKYIRDIAEYHRSEFKGISRPSEDIPFCGGMLGFIGYDGGNQLLRLPHHRKLAAQPQLQLGSYPWAVVQDHLLQRCVFVSLPQLPTRQRSDLLKRLRAPLRRQGQDFSLLHEFQSNLSAEQYREAFQRIQGYILAGDCYQVNLAQRFNAPYSGDPWQAYRQLRAAAAAPFAGYMSLENGAFMCLSPERFLSLNGHHVETRPIKGTRPRHVDPGADSLAAQELCRSAKDRAENLMIVDLLRNDMGKSCIPGSIHVDRLFELQSFPTVHHLVSTISGELREGIDAYQLLLDCFPGGSITGAPKRRAMEIIAELEPHPRSVYCGSMLYISADGRMDSNIAIRSVLCDRGEAYCWGGGGIVADSEWELEYRETYDKVGPFLQLLEQTLQL